MQNKRVVCIACVLALCFWIPGANAGTLRDDYEKVELKRKDIEKRRMAYEMRLRVLSSQRYSLSLDLNKCVAEKNLPSWGEKLEETKKEGDRLEKERGDLITLRIELGSVRNDHETRRSAIENKYRGTSRGNPYDTELRQYMESLDANYFDRIEKELFRGYQEYLSGVENFLMFMEKFITECRTRPKDENARTKDPEMPTISAKMEVQIKISVIPSNMQTLSDGMREFFVNTGEQIIRISVPPETWRKLEDADKTIPKWSATLSGEIGKRIVGGFEMNDPHITISGDRM